MQIEDVMIDDFVRVDAMFECVDDFGVIGGFAVANDFAAAAIDASLVLLQPLVAGQPVLLLDAFELPVAYELRLLAAVAELELRLDAVELLTELSFIYFAK